MWDRFIRSRRARPGVRPRSVKLSLERLEDRLTPSGPGVGTGTPPTETLTLFVTYDPNKQVTLTGQLSNQSGPMAGQTINLGGVVNGTATTDSQGDYSVTLPVSQLGGVTATSADGQSNTVMDMLMAGTPTINNFQATCEGNGVWLFSGSVTGTPAQGEVVDFSGIPALNGKQCTVNADGTFSFYAVVQNGQGGTADVEAVDWWGDTSQEASAYVSA